MFVRYESVGEEGLFAACREFVDVARSRLIRVPAKVFREIESLWWWLTEHTPVPNRDAYVDELSRRPVTWFRASAVEHIRRADRLVVLLQGQGVDVWRVDAKRIPRVLWEDDVQLVTRRPRGESSRAWALVENRQAARRGRQRARRRAAERRSGRRMKEGGGDQKVACPR